MLIQETQSMKEQNMIGYRFDGSNYYLVDFSNNDELDFMKEVAICYDGDVLLKHGHPDRIKPVYDEAMLLYKKFGIDKELGYIQGKFDVNELDKILSISDYIGRFVEKQQEQS